MVAIVKGSNGTRTTIRNKEKKVNYILKQNKRKGKIIYIM